MNLFISIPISNKCKTHLRKLLGESLEITEGFGGLHPLMAKYDFSPAKMLTAIRQSFDYGILVYDNDYGYVRLTFYSADKEENMAKISLIVAKDEFPGKTISYIDNTK